MFNKLWWSARVLMQEAEKLVFNNIWESTRKILQLVIKVGYTVK